MEILLFTGGYYASKKDIMAPSVVFSGMFVLSTFFAIINIGKWDFQIDIYSCFLLVLGIFIYVLTECCVRQLFFHRWQRKTVLGEGIDFTPYHIQGWKVIALLLFNMVVVLWFYSEILRIVVAYGMDTTNPYAAYRKITTSLAMPSDSEIPMIGTILSQMMKVTKASAFICSYIIVHNLVAERKWWKHKPFTCIGLTACVFLEMVINLISGGRNAILQIITSIIIEYYILWHQKNGWNKSLTERYLLLGAACVIVGIPLFYLALQLTGRSTSQNMFEHASIYIGSGIVDFDQYVKTPAAAPVVFGEESLLGIHQLLKRLGILTVVKNRHLENRILTPDRRLRSNIYTFFRRPLHDFGVTGMCIFTALVSIMFALIYYRKIKYRPVRRGTPYWVLMYGFIFYWIIYASIDQRSIEYITTSNVLVLLAVFIGFFLMTRLNIVWKK